MNPILKKLNDIKINNTIASLENNNINAYGVSDCNELIYRIGELLKDNDIVGCGGSQTLFETGVIEYLRSGGFNFLDRYKESLSGGDLKELYRKSFFADAYFSSANTITESGEIYNVDADGNIVASMLHRPDKVIIAVINKIVKNIDETINRTKYISASVNTTRLNSKTPCVKTGRCMDCSSLDRICCEYTLIKKQKGSNQIHVFILNEGYGF